MINSPKGYNYSLAVDEVSGFFNIKDVNVINKVDLLNRYGFLYVDFATILDNKIIFSLKNQYFDKRYEELTCQTQPI